jgi:hypothetical protein
MIIKDFLLDKISQPHPTTVKIVPHSVPIVFFGNIEKAEIATLSLNPSNKEFEGVKGNKRVIDRADLGVKNSDTLTRIDAEKVYNSFLAFFKNNPYRGWFDPLNEIFKAKGYEYYNDQIVHLDISPWATSNKWNDLSNYEKNSIIDLTTILKVLGNGNIKKLFINGKKASEEFAKHIPLKMETVFLDDNKSITLYKGQYANCEILGWSTYWQNSYLTIDQSKQFKEIIKEYI